MKRIFSTILLSLFITSCGYRLAGTSSALPPHIKSIAIPILGNSSREPNIENNITSTIRNEFINDGRLSVLEKEEADMLIDGNVLDYFIKPVAFTDTGIPTQYFAIIKVHIEAIDQKDNSRLIKQDIYTKWDYKVSTSLVSAEIEREKATNEASRDIAKKIVSIIVEGF